MSIQTWKREFYPKPASKATKAEALDHSIQKWKGYLSKNLKKHQLIRNGGILENHDGIEVFESDTTTCALCQRFMKNKRTNGYSSAENCVACPLFKATGKYCDNGDETDAYARVYWHKASPKLLIQALEKARAFLPK